MIDSINTAINNNAFDIDTGDSEESDEVFPTINCTYYSIDDFTSANFNSSRTFSVLHYNIHSVESHIEEFRIALEMMNFTFDVICLTESKILKDIAPTIDINIKGYQTPIGTPTESTKGGVLIYVKEGINFKPRCDLTIYKAKELESFFIEICNDNANNNIVGVIYRHPCMSETIFNDVHLKCLLDKLSNVNKKLFIAGDFNFDLLNATSHNDTFAFFDTMMSNFLLPVINIPTKINRINNTLIDNIFTNHLHPDTKSGNLTINLSDGHLPSFLIIPKENQNHLPKKHNYYIRDSRNFNKDNFISDYRSMDWNAIIDASKKDVNFSIESFLTKFNELLDKHLPLRKMTKKEFKQKYKPWISNQIIKKIAEKNNILKKYIKCKNDHRKAELFNQFKAAKNSITISIRTSKKEYYKNYFTENKNNLQKLWKGIKEIINIKSKTFVTPTCLQAENANITDPLTISNYFNDYFTSIADSILRKRKYNGSKSFKDFLPLRLLENFTFEKCDEKEIETIISSLNQKKSSGPNSIPTHILKLLNDTICCPLKQIFNLFLCTGIYPDILKISKTIPIHKKGSRLLTNNYRPISLQSNLNKILEKIVHSRIYKFLDEHQCIYSSQYGFRKNHSTDHALIEIHQYHSDSLLIAYTLHCQEILDTRVLFKQNTQEVHPDKTA